MTSKLTRERLQEIAEDGFLKHGESKELASMALAAMDSEHVRNEHAEWSQATFGDVGPIGPLKHLSKEALEAAADPHDPLEWADMQFLLWDAQRRMGISDEFITRAMVEKLAINKARQWPEPKDGEPRLHIKEQPVPVVNEGLYKLANHIASSKNGLPDEWQDWADELETDIRRAAMLQDGTLTNEGTRQVDELTMWIKRLVRSLKNANPDSKLPRDAMDYLTAKGLISVGDILR